MILGEVRGRAENLMTCKGSQDMGLVAIIELGEDVIEENHRTLTSPYVEERRLQKEQRQHADALLPPRCKGEQMASRDFDVPVIAMRSHARCLEENISLAVVREQSAELRGKCRHIPLTTDSLVRYGNLLPRTLSERDELLGQRESEGLDELQTGDRHAAPLFGDLLIPRIEFAALRATVRNALEECVALLEDALIFMQSLVVGRRNLAENEIEEASPLRWRTREELEILREKRHRGQLADHVCRGNADVVCERRLLLARENLAHDLKRFALSRVGFHIGTDAIELRTPETQILLLDGEERFLHGEHGNGFEEVRFPAGILAHEHVQVSSESQLKSAVVTELRETEGVKAHVVGGNSGCGAPQELRRFRVQRRDE